MSSSKPLTSRTGYYRLRDASVYWNYRRYHYSLEYRNTPPDKDSSYVDDMPCRHTTPLRLLLLLLLLLLLRNDDKPTRKFATNLAGDRLRI